MARKLAIVALSLTAIVLAGAAAAPSEVADTVATNGFFIEAGADASAEAIGRYVSDARSGGGLLYVVVLAEEPAAGATTYADAVLDDVPRTEGTVLVVAPETVGWASNGDVWTTDQLNDALDRSLDGSTSEDVVQIFVGELLEPSSSGGGGGWVVLLLIGGVAAVIAFFVWRSSRRRRATAERTLADLKAKAREQLAAVANDILEDEDEVAESSDPAVREHFDAATTIYTDATERIEAASGPQAVVAISVDLDMAIWHLDCAEALLDGEPLPPKPEPPKAPEPAAPQPAPATSAQGPPLSTYQRRSSRRSGFGADDMLKTVLAMQAMRTLGGGSRSWGRSSGGSRSGGSSRRSSSSSGRSRGGGRRRG